MLADDEPINNDENNEENSDINIGGETTVNSDKKPDDEKQKESAEQIFNSSDYDDYIKNKEDVKLRYAFCFPDNYEIGMSHLGMKILYSVVNERQDAWCERVFAPWDDMETLMRENDVKLYALESGDSLDEFDLIGFSLQYELCYSNVLNMLDLGGVPVLKKDRTNLTPIVIAGGPCACNAEPMVDFVDIFLPGEGEEVTNDLIDLLIKHKELGSTKLEFLKEAAQIQGVYVPEFYDVQYNEDGTIKAIENTERRERKHEEMLERKKLFADYNGDYSNYCRNSGKKVPLKFIIINNPGHIQANNGESKNIIAIIHQLDNIICIYFLLASFPDLSNIFADKIIISIYTIEAINPNIFLFILRLLLFLIYLKNNIFFCFAGQTESSGPTYNLKSIIQINFCLFF
mgnify:CR=1 FL=1